jgi:phosphatidylglycerophosphate synthase
MSARLNVANAVTAGRLAVTPLFMVAVHAAPSTPLAGWIAAVLFVAAAWSDVVDGRIARRQGTASDGGRILDHFADITFILGSLSAYVYLGSVPWWVPMSIAAAFSVYVIDSWLRSSPAKPTLITSRLGHLGGIANYVVIGVMTFNDSAGLHWLPPQVVAVVFAMVPLYSGATIATRFLAGRRLEDSEYTDPSLNARSGT